MQNERFYLTANNQLAIFKGVNRHQDHDTYTVVVNGVEKRISPALLTYVPKEKLRYYNAGKNLTIKIV